MFNTYSMLGLALASSRAFTCTTLGRHLYPRMAQARGYGIARDDGGMLIVDMTRVG